MPFANKSEMLGVTIDTSVRGCVVVDNKESRKQELTTELQKVLDGDRISLESLPSVLGRVQYAELRIAGRQGKLAMSDIREWERNSGRGW